MDRQVLYNPFNPTIIDSNENKTGLKGLLHTRYAVFCALFASIGGMTFGYDQGVIANVLVMKDFKQRFPLSSFQVGLLSEYAQKERPDGGTNVPTIVLLYSGCIGTWSINRSIGSGYIGRQVF
jgi:hypothetical protein